MKFLQILLLAMITPSAFAQWSYQAMDAEKTTEIYAGIASGWHLNKQCKILSDSDTAELDRNFDVISHSIALRMNHEFIVMVKDAALEVVSEAPYASCGSEAINAIHEAVQFAQEWAVEIAVEKQSSKQAN
jgi:hypothetical protein